MTRKNRSPAAAAAMHRTGRGDGHASHRDDDDAAFVAAGQLDLYRKNTKRKKSGGKNSSSSVTLRSFFAPKVTNNVDGGAGKCRRVGAGEAGADEKENAAASLPASADRSGSMTSPCHAAESRGKATTETATPGAADEESRTLPSSSALHEPFSGTARVQSSSSSRPHAATSGDEHGGSKRRRTRPMQQLYLDFGQSNFAKQIICTKCGMLYVHGLAEDAASHELICRDYRHGVSVGKWKKARVVKRFADASRGEERIVEVRPSDAIAYRQTVAKVKSIVDQELGFVSHSTRENDDDDCVPPQMQHTQRTAFLYVSSKNKIIGFCTTQLITRAYHLQRPPVPTPPTTTADTNGAAAPAAAAGDLDRDHPRQSLSLTRSQVPTGATLGVHQIWTHSDHRGRGVATALLDAARANVVFGSRVPVDMVAFSSPTGDGVELARRYIGGRGGVLEGVKVYDC